MFFVLDEMMAERERFAEVLYFCEYLSLLGFSLSLSLLCKLSVTLSLFLLSMNIESNVGMCILLCSVSQPLK